MQRWNRISQLARRLVPTVAPLAAIGSLVMAPIESANAARVAAAQGKKVTIELSPSDDFVKNDVVTFTSNGKKVGRAKIVKIKGTTAYGRILTKGKIPVGADAQLSKGASSSGGGDEMGGTAGKTSDLIIGVLGGFGMGSQDVKLKSTTGSVTETVPMSGNGFSLKGFADITIADELGLIARAGVETFNTAGKSKFLSCGTKCTTEIMYLTADVLVRYNFLPGVVNPFVAGGLGLYFPLSKKTSILNENKIASTTVFFLTGGVNIQVGGFFIPIQVEYGLFPPSNQVSTSIIAGRIGVGLPF